MLDAHSDLFSDTSLEQDFTSFTGLISYSGSFPYMAQEGFEIKPGHHNMISLTALKVDADDSMYDLDIKARNCRFYEESSELKLYKNYTYTNCLFECSLLTANQKYGCSPWYFPSTDDIINICDPWTAKEFLDYMNSIKDKDCPTCLPECNNTLYDASITTIPFRQCDSANMGMSFLCKFNEYYQKPLPKKYSSYMDNLTSDEFTAHGTMNLVSNIRTYQNNLNKYSLGRNMETTYDAFDIDFAPVDIYYHKSSVLQLGRESKMNWIDFLSTVGGLLGLVLGMGFVSFIEVFWLWIRVLSRSLDLNHWIA